MRFFLAEALTPEQETALVEEKALLREVDSYISRTVRQQWFRAFGPQAVPFFNLYRDLILAQKKGVVPDDILQQFQERLRSFLRVKPSPRAMNLLSAAREELLPKFRLLRSNPSNRAAWKEVAQILGDAIIEVAKDQGVYILGRPRGSEGWYFLQKMNPAQQKVQRMKDEDPALYEVYKKYHGRLKEIDAKILQDIEKEGLIPRKRRVKGRLVVIATDPTTGEEFVYDPVTQGVPYEQYLRDRKEEEQRISAASRVFISDKEFAGLDKMPDEAVDALPGPIEYVALTDDKVKTGAISRVLPVKVSTEGYQIVSSGRYKGMRVDALINSAGRMIEGTAYNYDPKTNRATRIEIKGPNGIPKVTAEREPYLTLAEISVRVPGVKKLQKHKRLYLQIPGTHAFTEVRAAMRKLAKAIPSVEEVEKSRGRAFYFDPKDFGAVREALGSLAMSQKASKFLHDYFEQLAYAERATAQENLGHYTSQAIGGFKPEVSLLSRQKEALAWMEARGNNGVCALSTGVGKTITSIAMMQKLKRDGLAEEGNGKFLLVCPKALIGNFRKEILKFLEPAEAEDLNGRLDILSYPQFTRAFKNDPKFANDYVAIFFDEAQTLRSETSKTSQAALKIRHPRKILLTASPMEKNPRDSYVLQAIAANIDVSPKTQGRVDMMKFLRRISENVGGRIVGVKDDPIVRDELKTWVKQNVFYRDKETVEEFELPKLTRETTTLDMPPEVEAIYRQKSAEIQKLMRALVASYTFKGKHPETKKTLPEAKIREMVRIFSPRLGKIIRELAQISNFPERFVPFVDARNPDGTPVLDAEGRPVRVRTPNLKLQESSQRMAAAWEEGRERTLLFTDDKEMVIESARQLSLSMPGTFHVAGLGDRIFVFQNGEEQAGFLGFKTPFRQREYRRYLDEPAGPGNASYPKTMWQKFVFDEVVSPTPSIVSLTLLGPVYATGQNLQAFSKVIHLDRDTWNSEEMKQRTARSWRQGQASSVQETTLDVVFSAPKDVLDVTVDEVRRAVQILDENLFNEIIKASQMVALGKEWDSISPVTSSYYELDRKALELMASPYYESSNLPNR